jgi:hypothetical protein
VAEAAAALGPGGLALPRAKRLGASGAHLMPARAVRGGHAGVKWLIDKLQEATNQDGTLTTRGAMPGAGADASRAERFREVFCKYLLDALVEADASLAGLRDGRDAEQLLARGNEEQVLEQCRGALEGVIQLDLRGNELGEGAARALAGALGRMPVLTQLDLGSDWLGAEGAMEARRRGANVNTSIIVSTSIPPTPTP